MSIIDWLLRRKATPATSEEIVREVARITDDERMKSAMLALKTGRMVITKTPQDAE